jgi:SAM-dependent methyltransferase
LLDVGCGTGSDAIWCAGHGWDVTGIDAVSVPIRKARRNARAAGTDVHLLQADIARIAASQLGSEYTILQDIGCFAGLNDADRRRAATTMREVATPGARLLMFAFAPGGGGRFGPRRIELSEIRSLFQAWDVEFSRPADELNIEGPMRDVPRHWHQLVKS